VATTSGTRYILAGFIEYGSGSHEDFMEFYEPMHDGHAAEAGFRTGDIIRAIRTCSHRHRECGDDGDGNKIFILTDDLDDDDDWRLHATSCELNPPNCNNVTMIIERLKAS